MANLQIGNLLGAVANATTAMSKGKSLYAFLKNVDKFGIQVKNNFEVNFSGLEDITFYVQSVSIPQLKMGNVTLKYKGRTVPIPTLPDYDHSFSMTVINDAQGYLYAAVTNFLLTSSAAEMTKGGYTMTIKALTGDPDYAGALVTCRGIILESVSGLDWGQSENNYQTFTINGQMLDWTYTPGALQKPAGWAGTVESLLQGSYGK